VAERRTRGAPGGDALAEAARRTSMSECNVLDLALVRSAWKSTVAVRLGAGNARLKWSKTPLPALENLGARRRFRSRRTCAYLSGRLGTHRA
jgi:hypothetical protein